MLPDALLLDMDGTLTVPALDFQAIKREMGIGDQPILEALARMSASEREVAERVLHRHEDVAAAESELNPGCTELMTWIEQRSLPAALITRNRASCVETVLARHGMCFEVLITRDDGLFKPDPAPLRVAANRLGVDVTRTWMIGDGRYDAEAGLAAGAKTVWISHGQTRDFPAVPWRTVSDLPGLLNLLQSHASD